MITVIRKLCCGGYVGTMPQIPADKPEKKMELLQIYHDLGYAVTVEIDENFSKEKCTCKKGSELDKYLQETFDIHAKDYELDAIKDIVKYEILLEIINMKLFTEEQTK